MNKIKIIKYTGLSFVGLFLILLISFVALALMKEKDPKSPYNYESFKSVSFPFDIVQTGKPGSQLSDETIFNLKGEKVKLSSLLNNPLVIEFGSNTCPVYESNGPSMDDLFLKYKDKVNIIVLYVREAHPGSKSPAIKTFQQKLNRSNELQKKLKRPVYVDSLYGTIHNKLSNFPNSVFLLDTDGTIVHRALWNKPKKLNNSIEKLLKSKAKLMESSFSDDLCVPPAHLSKSDFLTYMFNISKLSGWDATSDFLINGIFSNKEKLSLENCDLAN